MIISQAYSYTRKYLFDFVKYRVHLSLVFFLLLYYNNFRSGVVINYQLIVSFTLWHFALFLFDRIYDRDLDKRSQPDEYVKDHLVGKLYAVVAVCLCLSFILYVTSGFNLQNWFILLPVTFLYTARIYKSFRFKNVFLVKNLYSAVLIYALPVYMQSQMLMEGHVDYEQVLSLMIYVLIGEIFWDIRDTSVDKESGISTIPNTFGLRITKFIIVCLMIADYIIRDYNITTSAYIYLVLLIFIEEKSDRLLYHLPPLIALVNFIL